MAEKTLKKDAILQSRYNGKKYSIRMPKEVKEQIRGISKRLGINMIETLSLIVTKADNEMSQQERSSLARQQALDDASEMVRQHNRIAYAFDHLLERLYDSISRQVVFDGKVDYSGFRSQIDAWMRIFDSFSPSDKKKYYSYIRKIKEMRKNPEIFFDMWGKYSMLAAMKKKAMVHGQVQGMGMLESTMKTVSKKRNDIAKEIEFHDDKIAYENNTPEEE